LRARHGLLVFGTSWYQLPLGEAVMGLFSAEEHRFGAHAGAMETAMMLALSPQDVRMAQAQNFASAAQKKAARFSILGDGRSAKQGWHMQDYNPDGAAGNALTAQADHGQALVQAAGLQLARMLREVVEHPPL
jgi:creatinine amidohydrolase